MKPAPFDYHAPEKLDEAVGLMASLPNARCISGGQSLVAMMNFRYVIVDNLVDLAGVAALSGISVEGGVLRIGAMTRQYELEYSDAIAQHCPLMREALNFVGHRQTRNRGTIGGSLCHADPSAELPTVCATHDAVLEIAGSNGVRRVPFSEFSLGFMTTAVAPDEILSAIEIPLWPQGHGYAFHEFARRHGDFAITGAAALVELDGGTVKRAALTLCGVNTAPLRVTAAEQALAGKPLDKAAIAQAAKAARTIQDVIEDVHAGPDYRRHLAEVMLTRALADAGRRAGAAL